MNLIQHQPVIQYCAYTIDEPKDDFKAKLANQQKLSEQMWQLFHIKSLT